MEKDGLVEELFVQGHAKVVGNSTEVVVGDGLPDDAAAHGEHLDVNFGALLNGVGKAEGDVKVRAGGKQTVLCPDGGLIGFHQLTGSHGNVCPAVILVIGVNGVGKTTSIAKLADFYTRQGKKVMLAAGDTFRAAASEQLEIWADRAGVPLVKAGEGADPAAVIFDTVKSATARGYDLVIADTAGRLHNKANLMAELSKISRSVKKASPEASLETLLVLDAITGQNAISQAREFCKAANATGIILTKLDGTAKGGCVVAVKQRLGLPVRFIGVGEGIDDLIPFTPEGYVEELLPRQWKH